MRLFSRLGCSHKLWDKFPLKVHGYVDLLANFQFSGYIFLPIDHVSSIGRTRSSNNFTLVCEWKNSIYHIGHHGLHERGVGRRRRTLPPGLRRSGLFRNPCFRESTLGGRRSPEDASCGGRLPGVESGRRSGRLFELCTWLVAVPVAVPVLSGHSASTFSVPVACGGTLTLGGQGRRRRMSISSSVCPLSRWSELVLSPGRFGN